MPKILQVSGELRTGRLLRLSVFPSFSVRLLGRGGLLLCALRGRWRSRHSLQQVRRPRTLASVHRGPQALESANLAVPAGTKTSFAQTAASDELPITTSAHEGVNSPRPATTFCGSIPTDPRVEILERKLDYVLRQMRTYDAFDPNRERNDNQDSQIAREHAERRRAATRKALVTFAVCAARLAQYGPHRPLALPHESGPSGAQLLAVLAVAEGEAESDEEMDFDEAEPMTPQMVDSVGHSQDPTSSQNEARFTGPTETTAEEDGRERATGSAAALLEDLAWRAYKGLDPTASQEAQLQVFRQLRRERGLPSLPFRSRYLSDQEKTLARENPSLLGKLWRFAQNLRDSRIPGPSPVDAWRLPSFEEAQLDLPRDEVRRILAHMRDRYRVAQRAQRGEAPQSRCPRCGCAAGPRHRCAIIAEEALPGGRSRLLVASGSGRGSWKVGRTDRHDDERAAEELARLQEHIRQHQEDSRAFEAARKAAERLGQPLLVRPPVPLSADINVIACFATLDDCAYNNNGFLFPDPPLPPSAYGWHEEPSEAFAAPMRRRPNRRGRECRNRKTPGVPQEAASTVHEQGPPCQHAAGNEQGAPLATLGGAPQ